MSANKIDGKKNDQTHFHFRFKSGWLKAALSGSKMVHKDWQDRDKFFRASISMRSSSIIYILLILLGAIAASPTFPTFKGKKWFGVKNEVSGNRERPQEESASVQIVESREIPHTSALEINDIKGLLNWACQQLGINSSDRLNEELVRSQYRRRILICHPDKGGCDLDVRVHHLKHYSLRNSLDGFNTLGTFCCRH